MASLNVEMKDRLVDAFDRCLAMQVDHLTALQAGCLTKITQWLEERQVMVSSLRQTLTNVHASELDDELRALLLEKLRRILKTEKVLFTLAEQQSSVLSEKLTVLRRGKRTLGCYCSSSKRHPPQLVSDKG